MYQLIFSNWKAAALWAIALCASIGLFFSAGGGHEKFDESAAKIRAAKEIAAGTEAVPDEAEPFEDIDQDAPLPNGKPRTKLDPAAEGDEVEGHPTGKANGEFAEDIADEPEA